MFVEQAGMQICIINCCTSRCNVLFLINLKFFPFFSGAVLIFWMFWYHTICFSHLVFSFTVCGWWEIRAWLIEKLKLVVFIYQKGKRKRKNKLKLMLYSVFCSSSLENFWSCVSNYCQCGNFDGIWCKILFLTLNQAPRPKCKSCLECI